jgi:hypothetical protein
VETRRQTENRKRLLFDFESRRQKTARRNN